MESLGQHVVRIGDTVRRPYRPWTPPIHSLLREIRERGFDGGPTPLGVDELGRDVVTYLPGVVGNYPLSDAIRSATALESAARLLRRYHDATVEFAATTHERWMMPALDPVEVVCHSDFAPYNCVFDGATAIGIIDFETARPGPRSWDIGYALYRFAPLTSPQNSDGFGTFIEQAARARRFLDAYEAPPALRKASLESVVPRLEDLVSFMHKAANDGDERFQRNIDEGHVEVYLADIAVMRARLPELLRLVNDENEDRHTIAE